MKVTVDTDVLVRAVVRDDMRQARAAARLLRSATLLAVPLPVLCELVWVLRKVYAVADPEIAEALRALLAIAHVATDRPAAEAGIAMLEAGGDFADGVIAYQGRWLGAETFVSFDRRAVALLDSQGIAAQRLA